MKKLNLIFFSILYLIFQVKAQEGNKTKYGDIRDSVDLQLHTVKQTLTEYHPGLAYLEVTNNSTTTLTVRLKGKTPHFLTINSQPGETNRVLQPKEKLIYTEELKIGNSSYPGKGLILYELKITHKIKDQQIETSKVIEQEIETGILGESGIMAVLGLNLFSIPFFLVLPGFLFLVIWSSFLPSQLRSENTLFSVDKKEPSFWVGAITLSLFLSTLYALTTGRSVWIGYGLLDVFVLWLISIFLSLAALSVMVEFEKSKDFSIQDMPLTLLNRMYKREMDLVLEHGEMDEIKTQWIFRLGINKMDKTVPVKYWYSYGIRVQKEDGLPSGSKGEKLYTTIALLLRDLNLGGSRIVRKPLKDNFYLLIGRKKSISTLRALIILLKKAKKNKAVIIEFNEGRHLITLEKNEFKVSKEYKCIVQT